MIYLPLTIARFPKHRQGHEYRKTNTALKNSIRATIENEPLTLINTDPEKGSGSGLALALIAAIAAMGLMLSSLGAAQQARWQAQTAADLGAIAGASALRHGQDHCLIARESVRRNLGTGIPGLDFADFATRETSLVTCELQDLGQVLITVRVPLTRFLSRNSVTARAKAGPRY